ncbi:hypothetical protein BGZ63DRAFT_425687 [Mariannaea sp. PMI_226]|nr:hypothetical protein BGZ63DRAFT_425687 [Mariannaea sp. PMI_226]
MGADDNVELGAIGVSRTEGIEISRIIREEVRAIVREQMATTSTEPAPPSYDSTASLLHVPQNEVENALEDAGIPEVERKPGRIERMPSWLRAFITLAPIAIVFVSIPVIITSNIDPLSLSLLAFLLVVSGYALALLPLILIGIVTAAQEPNKPPENSGTQPPKKDDKKDDKTTSFWVGLYLGGHFLSAYLLFGLILWLWLASRDESVFSRYQLAERFDAKFDTQDALNKLTTCLYDDMPNQNATYKELMLCLTKTGMSTAP